MVVFKHKNVLHKQTPQCLLSLAACTSSSSCSTNAARCVSTFSFFFFSPLSLLLLCSCMLHQQRQCGSFLAVQVMAPCTPTRTNAVLATTRPLCTCPATSSTTNATITVLTLQQPHLEASWCLCCCCLLLMTKKHAAASQFVSVSQSVGGRDEEGVYGGHVTYCSTSLSVHQAGALSLLLCHCSNGAKAPEQVLQCRSVHRTSSCCVHGAAPVDLYRIPILHWRAACCRCLRGCTNNNNNNNRWCWCEQRYWVNGPLLSATDLLFSWHLGACYAV